MKNIRHYLSYNHADSIGEQFTLPSLTVPDMSLTPAEILIRFSQGRPLMASRNLMYTGDDYLPDLRKYDLTEVQELEETNKQQLYELQTKLDERQKARRKKLEQRMHVDDAITDDGKVTKQSGGTSQSSD